MKYVSKGDICEKLSPEEYLNMIRPYLRDLINEHMPTMELNINNNSNSNNNSKIVIVIIIVRMVIVIIIVRIVIIIIMTLIVQNGKFN